jgi:hypothetical protein
MQSQAVNQLHYASLRPLQSSVVFLCFELNKPPIGAFGPVYRGTKQANAKVNIIYVPSL